MPVATDKNQSTCTALPSPSTAISTTAYTVYLPQRDDDDVLRLRGGCLLGPWLYRRFKASKQQHEQGPGGAR
ncbi:hypothetical protein IAT38_005127 [Cryptococcus sp. DSM 104549]